MKNILRQAFWLLLTQIIGKIIGFVYTIYLARALGVSDFGLYSLALAYLSIAVAVTDLGFNRFLTREVAIGEFKKGEILASISLIRLSITSVLFAIMSVILYQLDGDKYRVSLLLLSMMVIFPLSISQNIDAFFIALGKSKLSAISTVILNLSTAILGVSLVSSGFNNIGAVAALITGHLVYLMVILWMLYKQNIHLTLNLATSAIKEIIKGSLPYGILSFLGLIYFRVDTLILAYVKGNFETGIYNAGYKFLETIVFIPAIIGVALFPAIAKIHELKQENIKRIYYQCLKVMGLLGIGLLIFFNLFLPPIIKLLLPEYLPSIEVIRILSLAIPFMFLHVPLAAFITSNKKYLKRIIIFSLIPLGLNILLNFIFIPQYGYVASSWITVFSDILSFLIIIFFIQHYVFKKGN